MPDRPAAHPEEPVPDFSVCGACGADAKLYVVWDPGDGWTCTKCWATDGGD